MADPIEQQQKQTLKKVPPAYLTRTATPYVYIARSAIMNDMTGELYVDLLTLYSELYSSKSHGDSANNKSSRKRRNTLPHIFRHSQCKAVNLCIATNPQDVYSMIMQKVIHRVVLDVEEQLPFDENKSDLSKSEKYALKKIKSARLVNGLIDRGVVKRMVMTSVYGVIYIGAKNRISE